MTGISPTNLLLATGTILLGTITAMMQGFRGVEFLGAASVPVFFGLFAAAIRTLFRRGPTNVFKWMFGWAVFAFAVEVLRRVP